MAAIANVQLAAGTTGPDAARGIFGAIIAAGIISIIIAPLVSKMLRFFPPVVTGTIILVIGISLMRIGINWIFGNPVGPTAPQIIDPAHANWLKAVTEGLAAGTVTGVPEIPAKLAAAATMNNELYAPLGNIGISAIVLASILLIARFAKGFVANISVLLRIAIGGLIAIALGKMTFAKVVDASWFGLITPFHFGLPTFDLVMIDSTGMLLALGDMTGKPVDQPALSAGLRTEGLGTLIGGIFNTFPYTSFSQNVGLVGVTGIKSAALKADH
ncbi:UraA Xanthine/uracil permeases [Paracoccaceae bacterium]|jgi:NCS2 family nucleobase:cation symporter-2